MANDLLTRLATLLHRRRYEIIPRTGKTTTWQHLPLEIRQQILYYTIKKIPHDILFTDYSRNVIKHPTAARILLLAFTKAELSYPIRTFRAEVLPINGVIALERNHLLQDPRCTVKHKNAVAIRSTETREADNGLRVGKRDASAARQGDGFHGGAWLLVGTY